MGKVGQEWNSGLAEGKVEGEEAEKRWRDPRETEGKREGPLNNTTLVTCTRVIMHCQ